MKSILPESYIAPSQALELHQNGALIIDVREEFEFADKGIDLPGVCNFPMNSLNENYKQIPDNRPLIIVCAVGFSSEKAGDILVNQGFKDVYILQGGILSWSDEGFPMYTSEQLNDHKCKCNCNKE